jgi:predicted dehydrogenase
MNKKNTEIGIGIIGTGFMGKAHANAFRSVAGIFNLPISPRLEVIADLNKNEAIKSSASSGFNKITDNWKELVEDPNVDIVAITTPNSLHEEMALKAISLKKTVYCEKPLSVNSSSAKKMFRMAKSNKIITMVGFSYLRNPMIYLAKNIIESGQIGEIKTFSGVHLENYMQEHVPHSFRTRVKDGGGALMDLGSHIVSIARFLLGPIKEVVGIEENNVEARLDVNKKLKKSEVDDRSIFIARFKNGVTGNFESCWNYYGTNMNLGFEITGTKGAIKFNQEKMNELQLCKDYSQGFLKIEAGPEHKPYENFCPAPGHHLGFNDLKVIEVAELLLAHINNKPCLTDFEEAYQIQLVIDAVKKSSIQKKWIKI